MNPFLGILLILCLSMGIVAGRFHKTGEISFEHSEKKSSNTELKAEHVDGIDTSSSDTLIKIL